MAIFTNQATLSYNNISVNSNVVRGEVAQSLSAEKTAVLPTYGQNDRVTYAVSIRNNGTSAYTYSLSDDLGAYSFNDLELVPLDYADGSVQLFINGVLQPAPAVSAGAPLEIDGVTIPAGGNAVVIYSAVPNRYAPICPDGSIVNTVNITTDGPCSAEATATVTPADEPILNIDKALSPCQLTDCTQPLSYTFTISNSGPAAVVATDDAIITDTFDPILNITSVTFNGVTWTEGVEYTYNSITGEFSTLTGSITVPAATCTQDPTTGEWSAVPAASTLVINGNFQ